MRQVRLVRDDERPDQGFMTTGGRGSILRGRIDRGEYVVDTHAVAEAMLSRMLIPAQLFGHGATRTRENDAGAGLDRADPGDR